MAERVLLLVESLRPHGLATQARLLAERLAERGWEAHLGTLRDGTPDSKQERPALGFGRRHAIDPFVVWKLRREVSRLKPAVVHAWGEEAAAYAAAAGAPLIATVGRRPANRALWRHAIDKILRRRVGMLVGTSEVVTGGIEADNVRVIAPGVKVLQRGASQSGPGDAAPSVREAFAELGIQNEHRKVAVVSRLLPRKGVKELLWIADLVRVMREDVRVLICGEGPELPVLRRFARMACDPAPIHLVGNRRDAPDLAAACDVFWQAGDEQSPALASLEAMASGTPVIADETPGSRQAITHDENGLLVTPGDRAARARATQRLLDDPGLRRRLGEAARETIADRYSADRMADEYAEAYDQSRRR